jgi:hypothetical protein
MQIILVGKAMQLLPHVMVAVERMASRGLGHERIPFLLLGVDQIINSHGNASNRRLLFEGNRLIAEPLPQTIHADDFPLTGSRLALSFLSPTKLISDGLALQHLEFKPFARALLRRLSSLCLFHCQSPLEIDYRALVERARDVSTIHSDLRFITFSRYSARQGRQLPQCGLLGEVTFSGPHLSSFMPLIALGEVLHVGKGTAFGMGQYSFHPY